MVKLYLWILLLLVVQDSVVRSSYQPVPTMSFAYTSTPSSSVVSNSCTCGRQAELLMVCQGACDRFPNYQIDEPKLHVTKTNIKNIYIGDLSNLQHLTSLRIDYNPRLTTIEPGVFEGMDALESLTISFNDKLSYLANGTFKGLYNLTELVLGHNKFLSVESVVDSLLPKFLPRLVKLSLNENTFSHIGEYDFLPLNGTHLDEINLELCQLEYIHPKAFRPLSTLRHLQLCRNLLNETTLTNLVRQMTRDTIPLQSLNLCYMEFQNPPKNLLTAIAESGVTSLRLGNNKFVNLEAGSFPRMPQLEFLSLEYCSIMNVESGTFNETFFPQLRQLDLSHNHLSGVSPGILPIQVSELDISWNSYNMRYPHDFLLGEGNFINMNLSTLNISYVFLDTITRETFTGLGSLTDLLGLRNASIRSIEPGSFHELVNLRFLNLENNPFPSKSGFTAGIFEGLSSLEVLVLNGCGISNFSDVNVFSHLSSLEFLMLNKNQIVKLSPEVFLPLPNLQGFSIENNLLEPWVDEPIFQYNPNISQIFLTSNKLTYVSFVMFEDFSKLQTLTIDNNMFICDCLALYQAEQWKMSGGNLTLFESLPNRGPYCEAPESWRSRELSIFLDTEYEDECPPGISNEFLWLEIFLSLLLLLGITCGVLGYIYRSYIRYWIFLARMDLRRRGMSRYRGRRRVVCKGYTNYQYDAFVSYSNEDRNFVVRLVAMLENYEPFLKLCVYERDFQIGTVISEAVLESVASSRRTLLIVSDAFAKSQWCMWELRLAEHHRLFIDDDNDGDLGHRDDTLIIVKLGDVRSENMTPTLKYLMRTRIYLEWDQDPKKQRIFWERLRATLAPPAVAIKDVQPTFIAECPKSGSTLGLGSLS